jgi:hypothetical protein
MKVLIRIGLTIAVMLFALPLFAACPVTLQVVGHQLSGKVKLEQVAQAPPVPLNVPKAGCATLAGDGTLSIEQKCFGDLFAEATLKGAAGASRVLEKNVKVKPGPTFKGTADCPLDADGAADVALSFDVASLPIRKLTYTAPTAGANDSLTCDDATLLIAAGPGKIESTTLTKGQRLDPRALNAPAVLLEARGGKVERIEMAEVPSCGAAPARGTTVKYQVADPKWCDAKFDAEKTLCVELSPRGRTVVRGPENNVVPPNRGLVVRVLHAPGANLSVTWGGTRGLTRPNVNTPAPAKAQAGEEERGGEVIVALVSSTFTFAPRRAGTADLTIEAKTSEAEKQTFSVELEVDELTWGAVRFGFASVFGDAATRGYALRTFAGGTQTEIALDDDQDVNFEAVLGFTPYLVDLIAWGGRSHASVGRNFYVAPYLGFGIIGQGASGAESFGSLHVGLEVEVTRTFSIAGTVVWRRVTTLSKGYAVGSPVNAGTDFTTKGTGVGFGLVLNVSPDFLQFATPSSSTATPASTNVSTEAKE